MKKKYVKPELCNLFAAARGDACDNGLVASICGTGTGTGPAGQCSPGLEANQDCYLGSGANGTCTNGESPGTAS